MGQEDCLKFLKKNKGKQFFTRQVSEALNMNFGTIAVNLKKLVEYGEVKRKLVNVGLHRGRKYWFAYSYIE